MFSVSDSGTARSRRYLPRSSGFAGGHLGLISDHRASPVTISAPICYSRTTGDQIGLDLPPPKPSSRSAWSCTHCRRSLHRGHVLDPPKPSSRSRPGFRHRQEATTLPPKPSSRSALICAEAVIEATTWIPAPPGGHDLAAKAFEQIGLDLHNPTFFFFFFLFMKGIK